jgi:hypothetical protein
LKTHLKLREIKTLINFHKKFGTMKKLNNKSPSLQIQEEIHADFSNERSFTLQSVNILCNYLFFQLKGHLFKMGLTDDPTCERCLEEDESATHILCDCEAIANFKISSPGPVFYGAK